MSDKKVKIIGYAKKDFFTQGIEYRNFSPDLVGYQLTSDGGTPLFTSANFSVTTNLDGKVDKNFVTNDFGDFTTLENIETGVVFDSEFYENNFKLKLNLDSSDVLNYAFFGSLREYIRVSLENIIINWPASIKITPSNAIDPSLTGSTVLYYVYSPTTNKSSFEVRTDRINNPFDINYLLDGSILGTFNETNNLRNLTLNYSNYVISNKYGKFNVVDFVGASASTTTNISFIVEGNPFPNSSGENIAYHIQPNYIKIEEFYTTLNDFENNLLNRKIIPIYTSKFKTFSEMDSGAIVESNVQLTWPTSDEYNIDFNTANYELYVNQLISIAESNDDTKSNLMTRFLVTKSISEFDSIPSTSSINEGTNGEKMSNALKIYGREFDEIKKYSDGISFANVVTYNKKNNTPDATLKNLARILGWGLTSSLSDTNIIENYLTPKPSTYSGSTIGLTNTEAEIELWRRLVLNTPWIWKSKGSRKAIEFLFKFVGVPDGLITFNEHVYVADEPVDIDDVKYLMNFFNDTEDITTLNMDSDGYPKVLPNSSSMYFQKGGLWYRTTGGENPDIDILHGNNPHIGPYDGGQEYINQFTDCLIPNFIDTNIIEERFEVTNNNLFTNYNNGTFDECCEGNVSASINSNVDFQSILDVNINNFTNTNGIDESGCVITSNWDLKFYLGGEKFHESLNFVTGSTLPTTQDYIDELNTLSGTTELSGLSTTTTGDNYIFFEDYTDCVSDVLGEYFKIEVDVASSFACTGVSGDTSTFSVLDNEQFLQSGLTLSFASSIGVTDTKGMDVSECFNIISSITTLADEVLISGTTCDTILEIKVGEPAIDGVECNYTGVTQQDDGLILLNYGDGTTSLNVHPECCESLGFTSEIGVDHYYVCRWRAWVDMNDCGSYIPTNNFDVNDYMIYEIITGGTTTVVPKEECCFNNDLVGEATTGGFHCLELVVRDCGDLELPLIIPEFGDIQFYDPNTDSYTTVVEFSECCTLNGFSFRVVDNGFTCYNNLNRDIILPTVSITNDACCHNGIEDITGCNQWSLLTKTTTLMFVRYITCNGFEREMYSDGTSVTYFCALSILEVDLGDGLITVDNQSSDTVGSLGTLRFGGVCLGDISLI